MILFFDTETTGLANFSNEASLAQQPHIVQLAFILSTNDGTELCSYYSLIRPDNYTIPENMVHGISHGEALSFGIPLFLAIELFNQVSEKAQIHCAHNIKFDSIVMAANASRVNRAYDSTKDSFCTMLASQPILKLKGKFGYKWPRLEEAYTYFMQKELTNAHDALADVRACKDVYFALQKLHANKCEKAEYDIKLDKANTIHVGPPPKVVETKQMWNGELPPIKDA